MAEPQQTQIAEPFHGYAAPTRRRDQRGRAGARPVPLVLVAQLRWLCQLGRRRLPGGEHVGDQHDRGVQQLRGQRGVRRLVGRAFEYDVVHAARHVHGTAEADVPPDALGQFERHVLGDVPEVRALAQPRDQPAGVARGAVVRGEPRQDGEQPVGEARKVRGLPFGEVTEVHPGDEYRPGQVHVRPAQPPGGGDDRSVGRLAWAHAATAAGSRSPRLNP